MNLVLGPNIDPISIIWILIFGESELFRRETLTLQGEFGAAGEGADFGVDAGDPWGSVDVGFPGGGE